MPIPLPEHLLTRQQLRQRGKSPANPDMPDGYLMVPLYDAESARCAGGSESVYGFSMQELASWTERRAAELNARASRLMVGDPVTEADAQLAARRADEAQAQLVANKKRISDFLERAAIAYRFPPSTDALDEPGWGIAARPGRGAQSG